MQYTREPKRKSMTFMTTEDQYNWLNQQAAMLDISTGQLIREAITEYQMRESKEPRDAMNNERESKL